MTTNKTDVTHIGYTIHHPQILIRDIFYIDSSKSIDEAKQFLIKKYNLPENIELKLSL